MQISVGVFEWFATRTPEVYRMSDATKGQLKAAIEDEFQGTGRTVPEHKINALVSTCVNEIQFLHKYQSLKSRIESTEQSHQTAEIPALSFRRSIQYHFFEQL